MALCCPGQRFGLLLGFCFCFLLARESGFELKESSFGSGVGRNFPGRVVRNLGAGAGEQGWSPGALTRGQGRAGAAQLLLHRSLSLGTRLGASLALGSGHRGSGAVTEQRRSVGVAAERENERPFPFNAGKSPLLRSRN